jgi:ankyrin repeat protein
LKQYLSGFEKLGPYTLKMPDDAELEKKIRELIEAGADPKITEETYGACALHFATVEGCISLIGFILERGVNIEATSIEGYTPLIYAAWHGHQKAVAQLVRLGANIEAKNKNGWMPLIFAGFMGILVLLSNSWP